MSPLTKRSSSQADLFSSTSPLRTQVITRRKDFDGLFDGFSKMRAVSYVISPDLPADEILSRLLSLNLQRETANTVTEGKEED